MAEQEQQKREFKNMTGGHLGAVIINRKGEPEGVSIPPGETIFLSDEEQELTANAPRRAEDNPFLPRDIVIHDIKNGDVLDEYTEPPLKPVDEKRPIPGATAGDGGGDTTADDGEDDGKPPEGEYQAEEEVATPEARKAPAKKRAKATA